MRSPLLLVIVVAFAVLATGVGLHREPPTEAVVVVRCPEGTPFRLERGLDAMRVVFPEGSPRFELEAAGEASGLVGEVAWDPNRSGLLHIVSSVGLLQAVEQGSEGLRLVFVPTVAPVSEYILGPGDVVNVDVFGESTLSSQSAVDPAGNIKVKLIGTVRAAGLTTQGLAEVVTEALAQNYLEAPNVTVEVTEYGSHSITVLGPVGQPGTVRVLGPTPMSTVLQSARGFTAQAGWTITVRRRMEDGTARTFDVERRKLESGQVDPLLLPDDVVTVAEISYVYIDGEVDRSSAYSLVPDMTLQRALAVAGGLTPWADETEIQIHRTVGGQTVLETVNLKRIRANKASDPRLRAGDLIFVPRRFL